MSNILVIGVGDGGANAVERMKEIGIPNANYVTFGTSRPYSQEDIPHWDLIRMNGLDNIHICDEKRFRALAENVKDTIGDIIDCYLNEE